MSDELYLILGEATAGPTSTHPTDARHRVLMFARAGSHDQALQVATDGLAALGWGQPAFAKAGIIDLGPHLGEADRAPAEHAIKTGFALRIYEKPLARGAN